MRRAHAVAPGGEHVAELVQQHAQEEERDEEDAVGGRRGMAVANLMRWNNAYSLSAT